MDKFTKYTLVVLGGITLITPGIANADQFYQGDSDPAAAQGSFVASSSASTYGLGAVENAITGDLIELVEPAPVGQPADLVTDVSGGSTFSVTFRK